MRRIKESKIITCKECGNMVDMCYCLCPYCGEITDDCNCTEEELILEKNEIYEFSGNQALISIPEINCDDNLTKYSDFEFQRLEKWRIGRANFP